MGPGGVEMVMVTELLMMISCSCYFLCYFPTISLQSLGNLLKSLGSIQDDSNETSRYLFHGTFPSNPGN